ncbi:hypothetical protein ABZP36_017143 [Zizania latifolia]
MCPADKGGGGVIMDSVPAARRLFVRGSGLLQPTAAWLLALPVPGEGAAAAAAAAAAAVVQAKREDGERHGGAKRGERRCDGGGGHRRRGRHLRRGSLRYLPSPRWPSVSPGMCLLISPSFRPVKSEQMFDLCMCHLRKPSNVSADY